MNLDIGRIENKQIRNVKNKDLTPFLHFWPTPFLAFTDRHHNVQKPLANLLEVSWKRHKDKIRGNSVTYEAFKNLLRKLVGLQNPQAIEIQQNLAF